MMLCLHEIVNDDSTCVGLLSNGQPNLLTDLHAQFILIGSYRESVT